MKTQELSKKKVWIFSLFVMLLFFGTAEAVLRIAGFEYHTYVKYMNFYLEGNGVPKGGYITEPNKDNIRLYILHKQDPLLFWRNVPNISPVNSQGFINSTGKTYQLAKKRDVYRIISLGGSCTGRGWVTYTQRLEILLNDMDLSNVTFEVINAGVGGYSSYQGMRYFDTELLEYSPDMVTVYFGWNDHWRAIHYPDKEQRRANESVVRIQKTLNHTRIYQLLHKIISMLTTKTKPNGEVAFQPRVSLTDYKKNIEEIITIARKNNIRVLLLTAPEALTDGSIAFFMSKGLITPDVDLIELHRKYNQVIRDLAGSQRVAMVDLESIFDALPDEGSYFLKDGVHHREKGLSVISHAIMEYMIKNGITKGR